MRRLAGGFWPGAVAVVITISLPGDMRAHAGPPYPIVSDRLAAAYRISVWTDPDATDDGSAGGQFWIILAPATGTTLATDTRVAVSIHPAGRPDGRVGSVATPEDDRNSARFFAALPLDHEGPFTVRVDVAGSQGGAQVEAEVQATYETRPSPLAVGVYLLPFLLVGGLWVKLLLRRRRSARAGPF